MYTAEELERKEAIKLRDELEQHYNKVFGDNLWTWYDVDSICPEDKELFSDLTEIIGD